MYEFLLFFRRGLNTRLPNPFMWFLEKVTRKLFHLLFKDRHTRLRPYPFRIGKKYITLWLDWQDYTNTDYILKRQYEASNTQCVLKLLRPQDTFVDAGANIGWFSLLAAKVAGAEKVVAIEPLPVNIYQLKKNIETNHANIVVESVALAESAGTITLKNKLLNSGSPSTAGMFGKEEIVDVYMQENLVSTKTLPEIFKENNISECRLLKIDIQGAEFSVFNAARELLADKRIEYILCEYNSSSYQDSLTNLFQEFGYRAYRINHDGSLLLMDGAMVNKQDYIFSYR